MVFFYRRLGYREVGVIPGYRTKQKMTLYDPLSGSLTFRETLLRSEPRNISSLSALPRAASNCAYKLSIELISVSLAATIRSPSCKPAETADLSTATLSTTTPMISGRPQQPPMSQAD